MIHEITDPSDRDIILISHQGSDSESLSKQFPQVSIEEFDTRLKRLNREGHLIRQVDSSDKVYYLSNIRGYF